MTVGEATTVVVGIVFVLSLIALGQEIDDLARKDDDCQQLHSKTYSYQHRMCVPEQH